MGERKGVGLVVTVNLISIPVSEAWGKGRGGAARYSQSYINSSQRDTGERKGVGVVVTVSHINLSL